jgi:hypothetical protein
MKTLGQVAFEAAIRNFNLREGYVPSANEYKCWDDVSTEKQEAWNAGAKAVENRVIEGIAANEGFGLLEGGAA